MVGIAARAYAQHAARIRRKHKRAAIERAGDGAASTWPHPTPSVPRVMKLLRAISHALALSSTERRRPTLPASAEQTAFWLFWEWEIPSCSHARERFLKRRELLLAIVPNCFIYFARAKYHTARLCPSRTQSTLTATHQGAEKIPYDNISNLT